MWLPESRLLMPALMEPGRKPTGPVMIDLDTDMGKSVYAYTLFNSPKMDKLNQENEFIINGGFDKVGEGLRADGAGGGGDDEGVVFKAIPVNEEQDYSGNEARFNAVTIRFRKLPGGYAEQRIIGSNRSHQIVLMKTGTSDTNIYLDNVGYDTGINLNDGQYHTLSVCWMGRNSNDPNYRRCAIDGKWSVEATIGAGNWYNTSTTLWFGVFYEDGRYSTNYDLSAIVLHKWSNRSIETLLRWSGDPYQFLRPKLC